MRALFGLFFDCYVSDTRSLFLCLIVNLLVRVLFFVFDCYVSDARSLYFLFDCYVSDARSLYFLFDCYVSDARCLFLVFDCYVLICAIFVLPLIVTLVMRALLFV